MIPMMLMMSLLSLLQLMMMKIWLVGGGGAPRGAVEARVPFSKHINVARAVFRAQNRWKMYLCIWLSPTAQYVPLSLTHSLATRHYHRAL